MKNPAVRRYTISVSLLMVAYVLILFGVNAYVDNNTPTGAPAYAVAALPALPIIGVFFVMGRLLVDLKDEYVRMLMVRQTLVATAFMLSVATVFGFIQDFGLLPHVPAYWPAMIWFAGLGVGGCVNFILESRGGRQA